MITPVKVESRKIIADNTWEVVFKVVNENFYFNAGQYIWLITPIGRKAFSISSSSTDFGHIQIIFRENPKDEFKKFILDSKNQEFTIKGPHGVMRLPRKDENVNYIVGGVGIAPVLSIVRTLSEKKINQKVSIISFNHSKAKEFYINELTNNSNINFKNIIGEAKRTDLAIDDNSKYWVLGPQKFVDCVFSILILAGVKFENIYFEEMYPSIPELDLESEKSSYFKSAVDQSINHIIITDANGFVCYANAAAEQTTGYKFSEMVGQTPRLWGGLSEPQTYQSFWKTIKIEKVSYKGEFKNQKKNGEEYLVEAVVSPILDEDREIIGFLGMEKDITEAKRNEMIYKKLNDLMVDRELRMLELKKQIKLLEDQVNKQKE